MEICGARCDGFDNAKRRPPAPPDEKLFRKGGWRGNGRNRREVSENECDVFPLTDPRVVAVIKRISAGLCATVRSGCAEEGG